MKASVTGCTGDRSQPTRAVIVRTLEELWWEEGDPGTARQDAEAETFTIQVSWAQVSSCWFEYPEWLLVVTIKSHLSTTYVDVV